jgi:putative SOS response-associated peptidase YedK
MCGRYTLTASPEEVAELFGLEGVEAFPPRYNIAPTQPILVVATGPAGDRTASLVRWGLLPGWVKDPKDFTLLVNARAETAAEKPSFRSAMRHRRALVPASGFYEWRRPADPKAPRQAYFLRPRSNRPITFAGLTEHWAGKDGSEIDTGLILTTAANRTIAPIHDRMPVVIAPEHFDRWLDCKAHGPREVADLLFPAPEALFEAIPVSPAVNRVANNGPDIQKRVGEGDVAMPIAAPKAAEKAPKPGGAKSGGQGRLL